MPSYGESRRKTFKTDCKCEVLLYDCETWSVRVADERMLEVFNNDSNHRFLHARCTDCVSTVELRRCARPNYVLGQLVQR